MNYRMRFATLVLTSLISATALAATPGPQKAQDIRFTPGTTSAELKGTLTGDVAASYRLVASAGQTLTVELTPANTSQNFNITAPGANEAMFIGSTSGNKASVVLPADGAYRIQTYLMRSAARRNEKSRFTLKVSVIGEALKALPGTQDAKVGTTHFHATAQVPCKKPYETAATNCDAGVVRRGREGTATVEIRGTNGPLRQILFVKGKPVASDAAQALSARREGDMTSVDIGGQERYGIPDALLTGG